VVDDPVDYVLLETPIPTLRCPTDDSPPSTKQVDSSASPIGSVRMATANYAACRGFFNTSDSGNWFGTTRNNGVLYGNSTVKFADIWDGTSNTFALGEKAQPNDSACWAGPANMGNANNVSAGTRQNLNDSSNSNGFLSLHPGGANFALCDASVRFISDTIEYNHQNVPGNPGDDTAWNNALSTLEQRKYQMGVYNLLGIRNDQVPLKSF